MDENVPVDTDDDYNGRRCHARSKQHQRRCLRYATPGQKVCYYHGAAQPAAKANAARRLAAAADPFIEVALIVADELLHDVNAWRRKHPDEPLPEPLWNRLVAARGYHDSVLDRTGHSRRGKVSVEVGRDVLLDRIAELQTSAQAES